MNNAIKNIVIINAVPINGGDEALLMATILGLKELFPNVDINVLSNNPILNQKVIKNVKFDWDWEYAFMSRDLGDHYHWFRLKKIIRIILKKVLKISYYSHISRFFASKREKRVFKILDDSDKILLSAGGYFHDFYGFEKRLRTIEFINEYIKKPFYFFSQSIGPFWKEKNYARLKSALNNSSKIILREEYSLTHLKKINYHCKNVVVSNDIAFYLYERYHKKADSNRPLKKIAVNFREWDFEDGGRLIQEKALILCSYLIKKGYKITFISTCQGVKGYIDDSYFAERIYKLLCFEDQNKCELLTDKYSLNDLVSILSQHDAYIGMRLHGAILSLLAGIPALNIAYEDKTFGIFESLGLRSYCYSYKEEEAIWLSKADLFIKDYHAYSSRIDKIIKSAAHSVRINFELLNS